MKKDMLIKMLDIASRFAQSKDEMYHAKFLKEQMDSLIKAFSSGYYAVSFYIPSELSQIFDIVFLYMERTAGFGAANRLVRLTEGNAKACNLPRQCCSYQFCFEMMVYDELVPVPDAFICATYACDDEWAYALTAARKYKIPFFNINAMQSMGQNAHVHLSKELERLFEILDKKHKRVRSIKEVVESSNKAIELKNKLESQMIKYPFILHSTDIFKLFTIYNDFGKNTAVEILQNLNDMYEKDDKTKVIQFKSKIGWLGIIPLYDNHFLKEIEDRFSCRIIFEELFTFPDIMLTEKTFFDDLAMRMVKSVFFSMENRLENIKKAIVELNLDGFIHFTQRNCSFLPGMLPVLRRELSEMGIPVVEIQGDGTNPVFFNKHKCFEVLEVFFEIIERKKGVKDFNRVFD